MQACIEPVEHIICITAEFPDFKMPSKHFFKCVNTFLSTSVLLALVFQKQPSSHLCFALLGIECGKALLYVLSHTLEETQTHYLTPAGAVDS